MRLPRTQSFTDADEACAHKGAKTLHPQVSKCLRRQAQRQIRFYHLALRARNQKARQNTSPQISMEPKTARLDMTHSRTNCSDAVFHLTHHVA
jgi:hypothetical protein